MAVWTHRRGPSAAFGTGECSRLGEAAFYAGLGGEDSLLVDALFLLS